MVIYLKKIFIGAVVRLVSVPFIHKRLSGLLTPGIKQILKQSFIKYFSVDPPITGDGTGRVSQGDDFQLSHIHIHGRILDLVQKNSGSVTHHTPRVNRLVAAVRKKDRPTIDLHISKNRYRDLILACYLCYLRRYPSQRDIDLWTDHLARGGDLTTLEHSLKHSLEFGKWGVYYLQDL